MNIKKLIPPVITGLIIIYTINIYTVDNSGLVKKESAKTTDYTQLIEKLNIDNIDSDFINYLEEEYPKETEDFYLNYNEDTYDDEYFHETYNVSLIVLKDMYNGINNTVKEGKTISYVGDVSLADNYFVGEAIDERGNGLESVMSKDVISYLNTQSLVVANAEFALGTGGTPLAGKTYTFKANPSRLSLFHDMNVELVTLANNHVYDYGEDVFNQSLELYKEYNINAIGAGKTIDEADDAAYYIINGYKFAFVNANRSEKNILTPGATETTGGVLRNYDPEYFISVIEKEKETADFVIALIHWGAESSHEIEEVLLETSHMYIDAGADALIGTHAHVLQGIEYYKGKPIFYNLGNFIFNGYKIDTALVTMEILDNKQINYYFKPALQENVYVDFLYNEESNTLIDKVNSWAINSYIDYNGLVTSKE